MARGAKPAARRWQAKHVIGLGNGRARLKAVPPIREAEVSAPIKKLLGAHRNVAWFMRCNTGKGFFIDYATMQSIIAALGGQEAFESRFGHQRWLEFGAPGASDYIGQMKDGRVLAIEAKAQPYRASQVSDDQRSFLATVNRYGGLGVVANDIRRANDLLSGYEEPESTGLGYFV